MMQQSAERAANGWVSLPISLLLGFIGFALIVDPGGAPRRIHERNARILKRVKPRPVKTSFFSPFAFDRLIGAAFSCVCVLWNSCFSN